jgi:hypothetical protein
MSLIDVPEINSDDESVNTTKTHTKIIKPVNPPVTVKIPQVVSTKSEHNSTSHNMWMAENYGCAFPEPDDIIFDEKCMEFMDKNQI